MAHKKFPMLDQTKSMAQALDIVIFNTIAIEVQKEKVVATVEVKVF